MSNLSLQNSLSNIFDTVTETNVELPQTIKIVDLKNNKMKGGSKISKHNNYSDSATSSVFVGQYGGNNSINSETSSAFISQLEGETDSAISSIFMGQMGGAVDSDTSSAFMTQLGGNSKKRNNAIDSATSSAFIGQLGGGAIDSATSSAFMTQIGGKSNRRNNAIDSATSSIFMGQLGGNFGDSATSSAFMGQLGGKSNRKNALDSTTSSAFMGQLGGGVADSSTSSAFMGQLGGKSNRKNNAIDSATSSAFMGQLGGGVADSATSSAFMGQLGGYKSKKQLGGNNEVNKLVSMLTSDSNNAASETTTETLEAQLREILNSNSNRKYVKQTAGATGETNVEDISNFFTNLKSQGVNVNVKLNDKTLSEFFNLAGNTTTEISEINLNKNIIGGSKKKSKQLDYDGGANAGFQAFLDFKKFVANKLKISNGPSAAKIAGSINTQMKEKHSDLGAVEIAKKNTEYFEKNIDKIKSEFKDLISKNPIK